MEKINRIIRIVNILDDIEIMVSSISSEHTQLMALILMDYCNETTLKTIHYELLKRESDKIWDCWKNIDKELKNKSNIGLSELPYKIEILNTIHRKRNFVQHSGESPRVEEVTKYLAYTKLFRH